MTKWPARIGMAIGGVLAGWLLVEIAVRFAIPILPPGIIEPLREVRITPWGSQTLADPPLTRRDATFWLVARRVTGYRFYVAGIPTTFSVTTINWLDSNSDIAFRVDDPQWQTHLPVDVVAMGDSFTFCVTEYDDCWVTRLQQHHRLSVVNLGVSGTGSESHLRVLAAFGLRYKPRIVIWQWYGNDYFEDYLLDTRAGTAGPLSGGASACGRDSPFTQAIKVRSAVVAIAYRLVCVNVADNSDPYRIDQGEVQFTFGRKFVRNVLNMSDPNVQYGWQHSQKALLDGRKLAEDQQAAFIVVLIPTKEEVYRRLTEPVMGAGDITKLAKGRLMLLRFCQEQRLRCFDATPALVEQADRGELLYWYADTHLNPAGNQALADAVMAYLREQGLVK